MRPSQLKHSVAVLRTTIGLGQKEFADLIGVSASTVQSIELGANKAGHYRLKLGEKLAHRICLETDADLGWLLAGVPTAPIRPDESPLTKETFERFRAAGLKIPGERHALFMFRNAVRQVTAIIGLYERLAKLEDSELLAFKLNEKLVEVHEQFFPEIVLSAKHVAANTQLAAAADLHAMGWQLLKVDDVEDFIADAFQKEVKAAKRLTAKQLKSGTKRAVLAPIETVTLAKPKR